MPKAADVVVIGGGIVGTAAAYFLAKRGISVALLEKGRVGAEQSSRNWGWCRVQGKVLSQVPLAMHNLATWDDLAVELGVDVGFTRCGTLILTQDRDELAFWEAWMERARDFQIPNQILTGEALKARTPADGTPWIAGWLSPTCGRGEPSRAAPALARGGRSLGVAVLQECAARGLETTAGAVSGVVTERGTIRTSAVLCAGGAWTSMFCRRHGVSLPQAGVFATAFRTSAVPDVAAESIGSDAFSMRRRQDGGYTVGMRGRGRVELTPQGLLYARQFLPLLRKRRKKCDVGHRPFLLAGA